MSIKNTFIVYLGLAIISTIFVWMLFLNDHLILCTFCTMMALLFWAAVKEMIPELRNELNPDYKKLQFYNECKKNGIRNISGAADKERAKVIADNLKITGYVSIETYFNEAKALSEVKEKTEKEKQQQIKILTQKDEEAKKHAELTRYANLQGRDKRIVMLSHLQQEYLQEAKSIEDTVVHAMKGEKEKDWATHGGIASAIAGGAAGLAVASDIQAKNAQIRARNEANRQAMMPAAMHVLNSASEYKKKANELQKEIEATRVKLVADTPAEEVLSYLDITTKFVAILETGAFKIFSTIKLSENMNSKFYIFEKVPAFVDGTISADLYQEGVKVGSALLVLPMMGIGSTTTIEGICLNGAKPNVPYEVKYTAYRLWAMEK